MFAGKQKAWLAALGAFGASLIIKITTGGDVGDMATDQTTLNLATLAADAAQSLVIGGVAWVAAYAKKNVAADGTPMQFVRTGGTIVNADGTPKGTVAVR